MRSTLRAVVAMMTVMTMGASSLAHAQIYSCKDSAGRTLSSDRDIPECASREMREIGKNGLVRRIIPAPLTDEQRRAKRHEDERVAQQAEAVMEARRHDQAILERFRNEGEIDIARKRAINDLQEKMRQSDRVMLLASTQLANAEAAYPGNKKVIPRSLQDRIDAAKATVAIENSHMQQYQSELLQVDQFFGATQKRYRELIGLNAVK